MKSLKNHIISPLAVMSLLIAHVESGTQAQWKGYLYAVAMLVTLISQSLANAFSSQMMYILGMNVKTVVTAAVYRSTKSYRP